MKSKKILIAGDSFASAQPSNKYGWPTLLEKKYHIKNIAWPGTGEYKIYQSLKKINLNIYDLVIVSHTSPNRLHTEINPLYPIGHVYQKSDLLYADVKSKANQNEAAQAIVYYFENLFDLDYYTYIHNKCCEDIDNLLKCKKTIHITHFDWQGCHQFENLINFYNFWKSNKGEYNHYTVDANKVIFEKIDEIIVNLL